MLSSSEVKRTIQGSKYKIHTWLYLYLLTNIFQSVLSTYKGCISLRASTDLETRAGRISFGLVARSQALPETPRLDQGIWKTVYQSQKDWWHLLAFIEINTNSPWRKAITTQALRISWLSSIKCKLTIKHGNMSDRWQKQQEKDLNSHSVLIIELSDTEYTITL